MFNEQVVGNYAQIFSQIYPSFDQKEFVADAQNGFDQLELKERIKQISQALKKGLPQVYPYALKFIVKASTLLPAGFEQMPLPTFVELYGEFHPEESLKALEDLTQGSTGEFAIRPFLKNDPKGTLKKMLLWSANSNEHIRRLSSEGCRPRLPWGGNFSYAIEQPKAILPILVNLRNDDSLYVRKSVANNLNDISKDHPQLVLDIAKKWLSENESNTNWIVKRALRTLLKNAHPEALQLFGFADPKSIQLADLVIKKEEVKIGDAIHFSFNLKNDSEKAKKLRVEYLIDYRNKIGSSQKVFQVSEFSLEGSSKKSFSPKQSVADMTTRKHFPGEHQLSIRVNGEILKSQKFDLIQ